MNTMQAPTSADVFERHHARIYRYLLRLVRNGAEAEDLVQETFVRAHRRLQSLRDPTAVVPWLHRIATHVAYDSFRQSPARAGVQQAADAASGEAPFEPESADAGAPLADEVFEQTEMSTCVQEFVATLPDTHRAALLLHDVHGLTNPEIARMLGCSLATVKIRLHRARARLRAILAAGCAFAHDRQGVLVCERRPTHHQVSPGQP
ncbi:MAG: RNA polymerase sigma factor [Betaproteobacteria bacterium]|nr:RNA polymerase sigma factor [Betaproteobacteria bacterium]